MYFLRKLQYTRGADKRLVLKSPVHTARVKLLLELFPDAQFVYIHRDPYDVFRSAVNMADKTYWYSYLNTPTDDQIMEFILTQYETLFHEYIEVGHGGCSRVPLPPPGTCVGCSRVPLPSPLPHPLQLLGWQARRHSESSSVKRGAGLGGWT